MSCARTSLLDAVLPRRHATARLLAFTLNTCAYTTEIFAGAIRATPYGEIEAARAYGMSPFTLYRRVILPSALRRALPLYSNEVILMLHATTVAFTATVPDILKVARDVNSATYQSFQAFGDCRRCSTCVSFVCARMAVPPRGAALARPSLDGRKGTL